MPGIPTCPMKERNINVQTIKKQTRSRIRHNKYPAALVLTTKTCYLDHFLNNVIIQVIENYKVERILNARVAWMDTTGAKLHGVLNFSMITGMSVIATMGKFPLSFRRIGMKNIRTTSKN